MTKGSEGRWWSHKNQLWKAVQPHTCGEHIFSGDVTVKKKTERTRTCRGFTVQTRRPRPLCRRGAAMCQREGGRSGGRVWRHCPCSVSLMETGFMWRVVGSGDL